MNIDMLRRQPLDRFAELPWALWFGFNVLLYLGVWLAGLVVYALTDTVPGVGLAENLLLLVIGIMFLFPLWALLSVAGTVCLGVLRLLSDVRWYWFRLCAILLFAVPFPLFVFSTYGLRMALPVAGAQLVTALLIVQPRKKSDGSANRNPAMADHR